jgi:hypothetical protein
MISVRVWRLLLIATTQSQFVRQQPRPHRIQHGKRLKAIPEALQPKLWAYMAGHRKKP